MKTLLYTALNTICPNNVFLQGTLNPDEAYPDTFITYWTDYTENNGHYDNEPYSIDWNFSVIVYSNSPVLVDAVAEEVQEALTAAGFKLQGKGNDIPSDKITHTGWAMDFIYKEIL